MLTGTAAVFIDDDGKQLYLVMLTGTAAVFIDYVRDSSCI
jgi:hypothetical protein